jgi:spore coat protein CotH
MIQSTVAVGCGNSSGNAPAQGGSSVNASGGSLAKGGTPSAGGSAAVTGGAGASALGGTESSGGAESDGGAESGDGGFVSTGGSTATGGAGTAGAATGGTVTATGGSAGATGGAAGSTAGSAGVGPDPSVEIYDPTQLPRFDIDLPQASIDLLNQVSSAEDPKQNTYVTATLRYGSETVSNIGLRLKGEGSFQKLDRKPPFKIKFDEFVAKQEFHGLRRLALNNLWEDPSFIAERLAYDVYRAAGLPAPRCNSALVYVNGTFYGVYANVEAEDKTFLKRWFPTDGGNLYEEGQKDFVTGAETAFDLETNETANDRTDLKNLIAAVQGAADPATFLADVGGLLDTAHFLKFTAVEAAVNQWDMYSYTVFYMNNFRLYDDPTSKKFTFLPWGHDLSMKPFRDSGKPFIKLFALARQGDGTSGKVTSGILFQKCLQSPTCKAAYSDAVREVITVWQGLNLEAAAKRYYDQVKAQVYLDTRKNNCCVNAPITNEQFEAGYQSVLTTIRGRVAALQADLAAQ